jgi:hypothetical protein
LANLRFCEIALENPMFPSWLALLKGGRYKRPTTHVDVLQRLIWDLVNDAKPVE